METPERPIDWNAWISAKLGNVAQQIQNRRWYLVDPKTDEIIPGQDVGYATKSHALASVGNWYESADRCIKDLTPYIWFVYGDTHQFQFLRDGICYRRMAGENYGESKMGRLSEMICLDFYQTFYDQELPKNISPEHYIDD